MSKQKDPIFQLEQPLFFLQTNLNNILRAVEAGNCCRVLGPRHRFKSKLMREAATVLQENGTHYTIYQSLAEVQLNNTSEFFTSLYTEMQRNLLSTQSLPQKQRVLSSAFEFQQTVLDLVVKSDRNIAIFIDDLEIAPPNLVALLLGVLRALFMTVIDQPGARFQAVVCGSLSLGQVALVNASRFESVSDLVLVDDLDEEERFTFTRILCREAGLTPTVKGLQALLAQTAGDLALITKLSQTCFEQMKHSGKKRVTPARVAEAIEIFLDDQSDWTVVEILRQIESNPNLLSCALQLLKRGQVPAAKLPIVSNETPTVLDLCGAFSQVEENSYKIKCELWARILRIHFTPARVGGLYAIVGYWPHAIKYLGQAVQAGQPEIKSELFTATINAMHASENSILALGYLAQGLKAAYPHSELRIYHRTFDALELVFPRKSHENSPYIPLGNLDFPEIEALEGPDYSIVPNMTGLRLLFPLRPGTKSRAVGLVSLSGFRSHTSPYQQRQEILQLTALLHQAARAIEVKDQVIDLLNTAKERADKLKTLNSILTRILHHRDRSEETILRLTLAGVTSGWGLEFNRAILFVPDDSGNRLVGRLAVGHLTQKEAEAEWGAFPHQNLEEFLDHLLTHQVEEKPLHRLIKHLTFHLESADNNLLFEAFKKGKPILSSKEQPLGPLPEALIKIIGPLPEFTLVPLRAVDQTRGILYVDDKFKERTIAPERFELLQAFVNQAALALENARALVTERQRSNILTELLSVEELINDRITKSMEDLFDEIVRSVCRLIDADSAVFYPLCPEDGTGHYVYEIEQVAYWGTIHPIKPKSKPRSAEGMAAWIIREGFVPVSEVQTAAAASDGRKLAESPFISREKIQAFVGVRLGSIEEPIGILYINWKTPHFFTNEELSIIQIYANFITVAIPSARRYQQVKTDLERRQERLETMARITSIITNSSAELESDVIRTVLSEVKRAIPQAHNVAIVQSDAQQNLFLDQANFEFYRADRSTADDVYRVDTEKRRSIAGRVIQTGQSAIIRDVRTNKDYIPEIDSTRSALAVPIRINGETQVALLLESDNLNAFSTEDKRLLEMLADHLAIAMQSVRQFQLTRERQFRERIAILATGLIHDINSAVANIPGLVDEIEKKLQSGRDVTDPLADLRRSSLKAGKISNRLRDFVVTGQFKPEPIRLETVIQNALNISQDSKPEHVTLEYRTGGLNPEIIADITWIELLLHNLILNTYNAIPTDRIGLVEVEVDVDPTNVLIRVKDNGKGISPENLPRIFEPGFTTKKDSGRLHGIGLYHCRQVVKEHHGDLEVASTPGIGTVFTISLPRVHTSTTVVEE